MRHRLRKLLALVAGVCVAGLALLPRPASAQPQPERTITSPHFSVTWVDDPGDPAAPSLADADRDGTPDSVEMLAGRLEAAWTFEIDDLGYVPPPGADPYPVYVGDAAHGYTQAREGGTASSRPSFIVVPAYALRDPVDAGQLGAIAAHELFHAIQFGYRYGTPPWIQEASSVWMEGIFEDGADTDHAYVPEFLLAPGESLESGSGRHPYGSFLFIRFLTEAYSADARPDPGIVRELWERMAAPGDRPGGLGLSPTDALDQVLEERGASLTTAWSRFLLWELHLDHFDEGPSYRSTVSGSAWPLFDSKTSVVAESCRLAAGHLGGVGLAPLSGSYGRFVPGESARPGGRALLTIEGPPATSSGFYSVKRGTKPPREHLFEFDDAGIAVAHPRFTPGRVRWLDVGVGNASVDENATLAYSLRLPGKSAVSASAPSGPADVVYGLGAIVSGSVDCGGRAAPFAHVTILQRDPRTGSVTATLETTTDAAGHWSAIAEPRVSSTYSAVVDDPLLSGATSTSSSVGVRVFVSMHLSTTSPGVGSPVQVDGEVTPDHPDARLLVEFRRPSGEWQTGAVTSPSEGRFSTSISFPAPGEWEVRANVVDTGDVDHLPGASAPQFVSVAR